MKPIKPDVANLSVTTHGSVFWNDERMGDEQLAQRVPRRVNRSPRTSSAATAWWAYQHVAQMLTAAQKSGC